MSGLNNQSGHSALALARGQKSPHPQVESKDQKEKKKALSIQTTLQSSWLLLPSTDTAGPWPAAASREG